MQYGVPEDELPRDVLDKEIALVEKLGVKFRCGTRIGDGLSLEDLRKDFDAFFVAMAITIIAGLMFATLLTMFVVPVLYATFYSEKSA